MLYLCVDGCLCEFDMIVGCGEGVFLGDGDEGF